ncbi:hypothetical protein G7Y89_g9796 [Cudoniella acicularis]|uniref:Uncharacterized protein n=1 Tax=Cudoniella acicularis TaxID=354080 RepID=A0A8H4RHP0_9HELO|nr:hypothetical protein G7Y89_g9796 [Cudoniella acicularis]
MRKGFTTALDDIIKVAQDTQTSNNPFDLYVSSYVRFFDNTTDGCDEWSFTHDRLSTGKPKLVKRLRTTINDNFQRMNGIQAEVIKNCQMPPHTPVNPNFRIHNSQPDSIFNGHRFCEQNHTFEDQYYNQGVWLWNLQYYDEKMGEEYVTDDIVKDSIQNNFWPDAVSKAPIQERYNQGTPEEVVITLQNDYNGNDPQNPANYKGGGTETIGNIVYTIQPQALRQSADKGVQYACDSSYKLLFNEYTVWGHGFHSADHGDRLKTQLGGCALLPNTWNFDYGLGSDGAQLHWRTSNVLANELTILISGV